MSIKTNARSRISKHCEYHNRICLWTQKGKQCLEQLAENNKNWRDSLNVEGLECCKCKQFLDTSFFNKQSGTKLGLNTTCKTCVKERDYKKYNQWPGYIRKKVVNSWSSHSNHEKVNSISIEDATEILKKQNYKCCHCNVELQCTFGTQKKKNCYGASLDRINTDIVGYGNGNCQWLCMSCNNGKNTMDDEEHKNKFLKRDQRIAELETEVKYLRELLLINKIECN